MDSSLKITIVTPERQLLGTEVFSVTLPGAAGELQILPGHRPLLTFLSKGALITTESSDKQDLFYIGDGVAEVCDNTLNILVDEAAHYAELSRDKITAELEEAQRDLEKAQDDQLIIANRLFKRAEIRRDILKLARTMKLPEPEQTDNEDL